MKAKKCKGFCFSAVSFILLSLMTISAGLKAETYTIDASSVYKEIHPRGYNMGTAVNSRGEAIEANNYYLLKAGKPWFPVMGEIHYARYPRHMWEDAILKMKAGGIDVVATYAFWIHHEEIEGEFDFSGQRDMRAFVQLCKKHDMPVLLRIGPWCHGEVRNGGFPDWMAFSKATRTNDPTYLKYATRLYSKYYEQCKGLLYKDDGPIIGIQLENEYSGVEHLFELKRIARKLGFDVPLYTVTGWGSMQFPEKEVLPVQAGYADAPWSYGTGQLAPNEQYLFMAGIPINTGVGSDVMPVREIYGGRSYNPSDYPWLTAELGLGVCVTTTRRPVITHQDAVSLMIVKLAGGANCLGYYMYHGGTNPQGKLTTLNEGGLPTMSYDFQCAVGEFGETYSKYHEMKLIHYWLQDFGSQFCRTIPAMAEEQPSGVTDVDTFRCMARIDGSSGYLFFSNYQRYVPNKKVGPLQVSVKLKEGSVTLPHKPITIPKDTAGIWPINLKMSDVVLKYATSQLITSIPSDKGDTYFFFAHDGVKPEYSFDSNTVRSVKTKSGTTVKSDGETIVEVTEPGTASILEVKSSSGEKIRICTLTKKQAMQMYRFADLWGRPGVVMADADVLFDGNVLDVRSMGNSSGEISIYPAPEKLTLDNKKLKARRNGIFQRYNWSVPAMEIAVELSEKKITSENQPVLPNGLYWACASGNTVAPLSCFRKTFTIADIKKTKSVEFIFRADDHMRQLWVNGNNMGTLGRWDETTYIDLTSKLRTGKNVIACFVPNWGGGEGGLVGQVIITSADGQIKILPVDTSWKASHSEAQNWQDPDFDDSSWADATLYREFVEETRLSEIATYELTVPGDSLKGLYDVFLDVDWIGDKLWVEKNDVLIADWFYHGLHFRPSLRHWGRDVLGSKLKIKITPITPDTMCYIEPEYKPDFSVNKSLSEIRNIKTIPQYRIILSANKR